MSLVTPEAGAEHELLFNEWVSDFSKRAFQFGILPIFVAIPKVPKVLV
jgi:hypothetical protein